MSNANDFKIIDGVLVKYNGTSSNVVIPDDVTSIGEEAFWHCHNLTKVIIPNSVTGIGEQAFGYCSKLTSITIPDGVTSIGNYAFENCESLTSITIPHGVTSIGQGAFSYCQNLTNFTIPDSVTSIGNYAFKDCVSLTSITISNGVTSIGERAFYDCKKLSTLVVENPHCKFGESIFGYTLPINLIPYVGELYKHFTNNDLQEYVFDKKIWNTLSTDTQTSIFLTRQSKSLIQAYPNCVSNAEKLGKEIIEHLSAKPSAKECNAVANFMTLFLWDVSTELLQQMYETIKPFKTAEKALKKIEDNPRLNELLGISAPSEKELLPIEQKLMKILQQQRMLVTDPEANLKEFYGLTADDIPAVKCKDGTIVPPMVMAWLLTVPNEGYSFIDEKPGRWGKLQALDCNTKEFVAEFDHASLQDCLRTLAANHLGKYVYGKKLELTYPICYYADETLMAELTKTAPSWRSSTSGNSAPPFHTFLSACMYSNTYAAMFFVEQYGEYFDTLIHYAEMRNTTEDAIRDKFMSDVGLDENGGKSYDLGNQIVTARLQADLSYLIELPNGKFAKSLPKKGADETKYATANTDFLHMKKSTKKIIKNRCDNLFNDFLSGRVRDAEDWCASYLHNPLLGFVAELLVWRQGDNTFTLKNGQLIDSAEQPYTIGKEPITVAHPMDMEMTGVKMWQKYFTSHGLKQPFAQMWEPVINPAVIKEDRYKGLMIPYFRFMNQEKHGITVDDYEYHNYIVISFSECQATVERIDFERHEIKPNHRFEVKKFAFRKYTRQINHIVGLLDKWTVYGRILNDDISITDQLPQFTLAQITDFIKLASENNCINCTAALLEYKNTNFSDFDPMIEFTLE